MSNTIFNKEKPTIVFWDDDAEGKKELLFTEIKNGLKSYGWNAYIFTDKEEAKKAALKKGIDAVVLDLKENDKPVGLDILTYLREEKPFLPIIMFTMHGDIKYIQSAMKGDVSYYLTIPIKSFHDVIRAVEVAVEREKSKEKLIQDRYFASIGRLAAGVAHFIKNSLWNIGSRAQYLLEKTDKENESYRLIETIKRRSDDANKIVTNLLNFARRKPKKDKREEVNIIGVVDDVLKLVSFECENSGITQKRNITCEEAIIEGDEFELRDAFLNIIKNAIEAMPDGGELLVDAYPKGKGIIITISDTGMGMDEEVSNNLFMPYYTTKEHSAGFGLFDTRRIIHNHNGSIKVVSEPGKGTVVYVIFKRKTAH